MSHGNSAVFPIETETRCSGTAKKRKEIMKMDDHHYYYY